MRLRRLLLLLAALAGAGVAAGYLREHKREQSCQTCYPGTWEEA